MYIEQKESRHIAAYLMKGAFEKGYPDTSISIGTNVFIGISKFGSKKYGLYITVEGKKINIQGHLFRNDISLDELSDSILNAINNSKPLLIYDFSLDPSIASSEANQSSGAIDTPGDELDDELDDELPESYTTPPENEEDDDNDDENDDELDGSPEDTLHDVDDELNGDPEENFSKEETATMDENEKKQVKTDDPLDSLEENSYSNFLDNLNAEEDKLLNPSLPIMHVRKNKNGTLTGVDPGKNRLFHVIDDDTISENMEKIVEVLTKKDKALMTLIYADAATKLLALFEDDIEKMSDATGISKTDILLASYERKFI